MSTHQTGEREYPPEDTPKPTMATLDQRRLDFIKTLHCLSERQKAHLLEIESDAELANLKRVACDAQWFEVAAAIVAVIKAREAQSGLRYVGEPSQPRQCKKCGITGDGCLCMAMGL